MMNKKSLYKLEYNKIIEKLTEHAGSFGGQERCRKLKPKTEISEIERMQEETAAAFTRIVKKGRPSFGGCSPVSESMMRLEIGGTLGSGELLRICKVLETAGHVKNYGRHDNADDTQDILVAILNSLFRYLFCPRKSADVFRRKMRSVMMQVRSLRESAVLWGRSMTRFMQHCLPW